jgi:hypothetical protein
LRTHLTPDDFAKKSVAHLIERQSPFPRATHPSGNTEGERRDGRWSGPATHTASRSHTHTPRSAEGHMVTATTSHLNTPERVPRRTAATSAPQQGSSVPASAQQPQHHHSPPACHSRASRNAIRVAFVTSHLSTTACQQGSHQCQHATHTHTSCSGGWHGQRDTTAHHSHQRCHSRAA